MLTATAPKTCPDCEGQGRRCYVCRSGATKCDCDNGGLMVEQCSACNGMGELSRKVPAANWKATGVIATRYPELGYIHDGDVWRIVDLHGGLYSRVGPSYRTKTELLNDLRRFASEYGC